VEQKNNSDYVSLTDIAKYREEKEPYLLINAWLKNSNTLLFISEWEQLHNEKFNPIQMDRFRLSAQDNGYMITAKRLIESVEPIGIISKSGRYGGTFAHSDYAINFMYWLSPKFQVYFIKEFQELKKAEIKEREFYLNKIFNNTLESNQYTKFLIEKEKRKRGNK